MTKTNTDFELAVVLDFEATCDKKAQPRPQEIIELPSVLVDLRTREPVAEFSSFVRPTHHPRLSRFCQKLTSITQADVDGADVFAVVFARHQDWLAQHGADESSALIVTCGDWDLATMLPAQCRASDPPIERVPPIYTRWLNIKRLFSEVRGVDKAPGMAGMLRTLGLPLVGHHHRGIDDCRNIAALLRALLAAGGAVAPTGQLTPDA